MTVILGRNRDYRALWVGQAVSNLGISVSSFAYPLVVLAATGSPLKAGVVGSVLAGTAFVLRIPAGVLVDRWNRRAILVGCDLGRAGNAAAFAIVLAMGHFFYPQVLLVAFNENDVAGHICFRIVPIADDSGQVVVQAHLDAFGVKPGFEKLEIGPALKLAAQERAVALKCSAFVGF